MQDYNPIQSTELISSSRTKINNNLDSITSHFSGTFFPTNNLQAGMYCWRTDLNKMYQLKADLEHWVLVHDMSQGYNSVAHANRADYATKDEDGNNIKNTYYKSDLVAHLKDDLYPIGSILITLTSTNPSTWLGGEWQQIAGGRTLLGASSSYQAGSVGGSADAIIPYHTHEFTGSAVNTGNESATHTHGIGTLNIKGSHSAYDYGGSGSNGAFSWSVSVANAIAGGGWENFAHKSFSFNAANGWSGSLGTETSNHQHSVTAKGTNSYVGTQGNTNGANMMPYLVTYIWQKVRMEYS